MFTGIIRYICDIVFDGSTLKLLRNIDLEFDNLNIGDSICINGVCLTVISIDKDFVYFFVMIETISKTTFDIIDKNVTHKANLELGLSVDNKYDGHFVLGHVHGTAIICDIVKNIDNSHDFFITLADVYNIIKYDCVTINGISLTVADVIGDKFKVCIIPHTYNNTTLSLLKVGDEVNIESNIKSDNSTQVKLEYKSEADIISKAIAQLKLGKPVIVMDDDNRENEGDLIIPAEFMTSDMTTFFVNNTTGILCVSLENQRANKLGLGHIMSNNTDANKTPFGIPCDHKSCKTGVSSDERTTTIKHLANNDAIESDFTRPGHMQILISSPAGLFDRRGHTEASVELCRLAGVTRVASLAELVNRNGTMMRYDDCVKFSIEHDLLLITIEQIKKYIDDNLNNSSQVNCRPISSCNIYLKSQSELDKDNLWKLICYNFGNTDNPHKVLVKGNISNNKESPILVRVHSECFTGDVLGSMMCDCGEQLQMSLKMISENGSGIVIFPALHEGRGIGLVNKVKAYKIMNDSNYEINTYEANRILGFEDDQRSYTNVVDILDDLDVNYINLLTNDKTKILTLQNKIQQITPLVCEPNNHNKHYLQTKNSTNNKFLEVQSNKIEKFNILAQKKLSENNYNVAIISTYWHSELIDPFCKQIQDELIMTGISVSNITNHIVPGVFEIPFYVKKLIEKADVIICLGLVIKGDTYHFEVISETVASSIMQIQLQHNIPIINGILNCYNVEQALERYSESSGMAKSLAISAINMLC